MQKVQFKGTKGIPRYIGAFTASDGDEKEVTVEEAERLCNDFPKNFKKIGKAKDKSMGKANDKSMGSSK